MFAAEWLDELELLLAAALPDKDTEDTAYQK